MYLGWYDVSTQVQELKKCTTLVADVDNRRGGACVGAGNIWDFSVPFFQFCCEPKPTLKK